MVYGLILSNLLLTIMFVNTNSTSTVVAGDFEPSVPVSYIISVVIPITVVLSLLFGISLCLCYIRYYKRKVKRKHRNLNNTTVDETQVEVAETSLMKREQSLLHNLPKSLLINRTEIEVSSVIGQGEFGIIYKGYLNSNTMDTVAIKTLKGIFATTNDIESMSKEIEKMQHFEHPNVMSLIGVCKAPPGQGTNSGAPCIVMPFMIKGSLLNQLRKESDEFNVTSEEDKQFKNVKKVLLQMCLQIAKGMEYLAGQKFVHRDLAARNCLVDANGIIKVSDFGLAEDIYCQNYFHQAQGGTKLPLKWMAIESITQGKFTEKSDVWAYGITCWEVFTGGSMPYPGMHPREVLDFLQNGERSARPKNAACDSNMYDLMQSCWESKDSSRPSFSDIVTYLTSSLDYLSDYLDLNGLKNGTPTIKSIAECSTDDPKPVYDSIPRVAILSHTPSITIDYYLAEN